MKKSVFTFLTVTVVQFSTIGWLDCASAFAQSSSPMLYGSVRLSTEQVESQPMPTKAPPISIPKPELKKVVIQKQLPVIKQPIKIKAQIPLTPPSRVVPKPQSTTASLSISRLDPQLWPGNTFDKKLANKLLSSSRGHHVWRNIPDWRAGGWQCSQETNTRWLKYANGKTPIEQKPMGAHAAAGAESIGLQKDKFGNIWDEFGGGYWQEMDYGTDSGHTFVKVRQPGESGNTDYYAESVEFDVDKQTNKIKSVQQRRTQSRSSYVAPDIMKEEEAHTAYNEKGSPIESGWNTILLRRISPFVEVESERSDFVRYLTDKGLQSLIPGGSVTAKQSSAQNRLTKPISPAIRH
jgi:hypothetical protein